MATSLLTEQTVWLILLAGLLGYLEPGWGASLQRAVLPLLALMVVGVGIGQSPRALLGQPRDLVQSLPVVAIQLTLLPLVAFGLSRALPVGNLRLGLVVVGLAPAEVTSALAALLAKGSATFALRVLAISLAASTVSTPLWLSLFGTGHGGLSATNLFVELLLAIVVPLIAASLLRVAAPRVANLERVWAALSAVAVVLLIFIVAGGLRDLPVDQGLLQLGAALAAFVAVCYLLGFLLGLVLRLPEGERRAVLFSTGMREFGVAAAVATAAFSTTAAAVAAIYGVMMISTSFWLVNRLRG
ncbi:MAG: bile acid:sodium symporter family protein [Dehalococcoidia bacterium]